MHNENAPSGVVKALVRRKVGIAALRRIHSLIREDETEEVQARGIAARGTSVLFAGAGVAFISIAATEAPRQLVSGASSVTSLITGALVLLLFLALAIGSFATSAYLWVPGSRSVRPLATSALAVWLATGVTAAVVYVVVTPVTRCPDSLAIPKSSFDESLGDLTHCLASPGLQPEARRAMLQARAAAQNRVRNFERAIEDLEASFGIEPPRTVQEIATYSHYLRSVGRLTESLDVVARAGPQSSRAGIAALEFERGRTLRRLGRHTEAIDAFTRVLSANRSHAWAYWYRGLSYERSRERDSARSDFEECSRQLKSRAKLRSDELDLLEAVNAKLLEYQRRDEGKTLTAA